MKSLLVLTFMLFSHYGNCQKIFDLICPLDSGYINNPKKQPFSLTDPIIGLDIVSNSTKKETVVSIQPGVVKEVKFIGDDICMIFIKSKKKVFVYSFFGETYLKANDQILYKQEIGIAFPVEGVIHAYLSGFKNKKELSKNEILKLIACYCEVIN